MDAVKSGVTQYNIASDPQRERIHRLEDKIRRRLGVGSYITQRRLMEEMMALGVGHGALVMEGPSRCSQVRLSPVHPGG